MSSNLRRFFAACGFLLISAGGKAAEPYLSGGTEPFAPEIQAVLDRHAEILSLGINRDWFGEAVIDPHAVAAAIDPLAQAAKAGHLPGAVLFVDRFVYQTMPIGIGWRMTDPQKHPVQYDTPYALHDLTGPLVTVPLVLMAIDAGELAPDEKLEELLAPLKGSPLGPVTVGQLLRHTSGVGARALEEGPLLQRREAVLELLKGLKLEAEPGARVEASPANFLLLGLVMERLRGKPFYEIVRTGWLSTPGAPGFEHQQGLRAQLAAGLYDQRLGRMVWGEPSDPAATALHPHTGHTGLMAPADALLPLLQVLWGYRTVSVGADGTLLAPGGAAFLPSAEAEGGDAMGMGFQLGGLGPGSFGWESPKGPAFWIVPEAQGFVLILSNADHPARPRPEGLAAREQAFQALQDAFGPLPAAPIDTPAATDKAQKPPQGGPASAPASF